MRKLLEEIERVLPEGGSWCDLTKATTLASLVVALSPTIVVELGVWMGGSLIPILLALQHVGAGKAIAIDPWLEAASVAGQDDPANVAWWNATDHEKAYQSFRGRLARHDLTSICEIRRQASDAAEPTNCQLLHVDANHGPQAARDIERFAPHVTVGGILVLDDLDWQGGHVQRARDIAYSLGFVNLYPLGTGIVMQRRKELS